MGKRIYSIFINDSWTADFEKLSDLTLFIRAICENYYRELEYGINFKIKEFSIDDNGIKKEVLENE